MTAKPLEPGPHLVDAGKAYGDQLSFAPMDPESRSTFKKQKERPEERKKAGEVNQEGGKVVSEGPKETELLGHPAQQHP